MVHEVPPAYRAMQAAVCLLIQSVLVKCTSDETSVYTQKISFLLVKGDLHI